MKLAFKNTANHKRMIMALASGVFGVFADLIFYQGTHRMFSQGTLIALTVWRFFNYALIGFLVFEFLYRTRRWLNLLTLSVYAALIVVVSRWLYFNLIKIESGAVALNLHFNPFLNLYYPLRNISSLPPFIPSIFATVLAYFLICGNSDFTKLNKEPESESSYTNLLLSKLGVITPYLYAAALLFSIVVGFIGGTSFNKNGGYVSSVYSINMLSLYIFPAYLIVDGILNKNFLWCPFRAASLPLVQGLVMWLVTGGQDSSAPNLTGFFTESLSYFIGSLVLVAVITHASRLSFKARGFAIGFFGWFIFSSVVILISSLLFYWQFLVLTVTVVVIGALFSMKRNWLAYGVMAAVVANILTFLLLFGFIFGGGLNWDTLSLSLLYGITSPFFMVGGYF